MSCGCAATLTTGQHFAVINYPRQHNNLLLLDWTTCFNQLIGHPHVLLYCEVFREQCTRFGIPKRVHCSLNTSQYNRTWGWPINRSKHV